MTTVNGPAPADEAAPAKRFLAATALFLLAIAAAFRVSDHFVRSGGPGAATSAAGWPKPGKIVRKIPLRVFKSIQGLRPGVAVGGTAADGHAFIGIVYITAGRDGPVSTSLAKSHLYHLRGGL